MKTTTNHALKKPDGTDIVNIEDLNYNADKLDGILVPATKTTNGLMSSADKTKLDGVATGANKYTHPATHPASMISGLSTVATTGSYADLLNKPSTFPPSSHTHDDRYYTETEINTKLNAKANASHTHDYLPIAGGTVTGNIMINGTTDLVGNVGCNGSVYLKVDGSPVELNSYLSALNAKASTGTIKSVQRGTYHLYNSSSGVNTENDTAYVDITISPVDVSKSFVIYNSSGNTSSSNTGYRQSNARLLNSTTIRLYTTYSFATWFEIRNGNWQVIEFY